MTHFKGSSTDTSSSDSDGMAAFGGPYREAGAVKKDARCLLKVFVLNAEMRLRDGSLRFRSERVMFHDATLKEYMTYCPENCDDYDRRIFERRYLDREVEKYNRKMNFLRTLKEGDFIFLDLVKKDKVVAGREVVDVVFSVGDTVTDNETP